MISITHLNKHAISATILLLLTACNSPFTPVKPDDTSPSTATTDTTTTEPSTWQQAYGDPQEPTENSPEPLPNNEPQQITPLPITDLWQRIRNGYAIKSTGTLHPKTEKQLAWFVSHPEYINRVADRARPYLHYIVDELEQRNMPLELALLPVVESAYQPFAYSSGRAAGIWQFIPGTGKVYGLDQNWWYDGRRDILESTRAALDYLQKLHADFGTWPLALAAYNSGEGTVGRAIKRNIKAGKATDFWSLTLPKETSAYVPKLLAIAELIKQPEHYDLTLNAVDNSPFLTVVEIGSQIDLALAAKMATITTDEIYQLNPGFSQWATSPHGPHRLVLPLSKADIFQQALDAMPIEDRVRWTRHKIHAGESLGLIAQHYKTTIAVIKKANGLATNRIRTGHHLLIPIASGKPSDYPLTAMQRLATRQNTPHKGTKKIHTVQSGDTWWDIAKAHHIGVKQLTHWNGKSPRDTLNLGQKLVIWIQHKPKNTHTQTINYTTKQGDSLWKISQQFNVSIAQLQQWNGLSDRTLLKPGQNLTMHIDIAAQTGSSI